MNHYVATEFLLIMHVFYYALLLVLSSHLVLKLDLLDSSFLVVLYFSIMAIGHVRFSFKL